MLVIDTAASKGECRLERGEKPPVDLSVPYGADMFIRAFRKVQDYGYAVAVDEKGSPKAVIKQLCTTYVHTYADGGEMDLSFLNQYDCICLNGCNEFSVEICKSVLPYWRGKRLVLLGADWNDMIAYLPDISGVDCFYDPNMDDRSLQEITEGVRPLFVTTGLPHQEDIGRYRQGLVMYDEVMAMTFLFSDQREHGEKNQEKRFFVINAAFNNLGLFGIFGKVSVIARYVKSKNMIPVVNLTKSDNSMYSDFPGDEIWNKFYNQPEAYTMEDVLESKHVYYSPQFYNGSVLCHMMEQASKNYTLSWRDGIYNKRVVSCLEEGSRKYLPYPQKTLGVLARGTDYVNSKFLNHPIHATLPMLFEKIDAWLAARPELEYVYVATEDEEYIRRFKERYRDRLYCTEQNRFSTKPDEMLAEMHRKREHPIAGYTLGTDYILSVYLLAQCRAFIASGGCAGYYQALEENKGRWEDSDVFLFDLGKNPGN